MRYLYLLFLLFGFTFHYATAQSKNFLDLPYLETNASIDTLVVPDRIYLIVLLQEADTKDRTSVEVLENKMAAKLRDLGIDTDKQLFLADLGSNFKDYFLRKTGVLKSKAYTVLVYSALSAGEVIQGLESVGIANITFQKAEVSNIEALKLELRKKAIIQAKQQALSMLEPLGQTLGKAVHISDINTGIVYGWERRPRTLEMSARADMEQPLDIDFQKVKLSSTINVKFLMQ